MGIRKAISDKLKGKKKTAAKKKTTKPPPVSSPEALAPHTEADQPLAGASPLHMSTTEAAPVATTEAPPPAPPVAPSAAEAERNPNMPTPEEIATYPLYKDGCPQCGAMVLVTIQKFKDFRISRCRECDYQGRQRRS